MESHIGTRLAALGFLRLGLFGLAILNVVLPACYWLAGLLIGKSIEQFAWAIVPNLIAPVMAPILVVVILFDYIMSRVRAADAQGEEHSYYLMLCRIELFFIGMMLAYWIPFFLTL